MPAPFCGPNQPWNPNTRFVAGPPGPDGTPGPQATGSSFIAGVGVPASSIGNNGDLYVDTATSNLYGPKTAGNWGSAFQLQGTAAGPIIIGTFPNLTLAASGITPGTYSLCTVDIYGRVTAGAQLQPGNIPGGVELQANKNQPNGYAGLDANAFLLPALIPALTGNVTLVAGQNSTVIANGVINNSMFANMASETVKGNATGSAGPPTDITFTALATALSVAVTAVKSVRRQIFSTSGTYTPSTSMIYCLVEAQGGGGGGGGAAGTSAQSASGGGGGGGEYGNQVFAAATVGASQTVTIGAVGAAGTAGANNGTNGGTTSLGSILTALGGVGGTGASSSATMGFGAQGGAGGTGGTGSNYAVPGAPGGSGLALGSGAAAQGGRGGASFFGNGGGGGVTAAGSAGTGYGAGGGGGGAGATSTAGAAGTAGFIVVTEFCST